MNKIKLSLIVLTVALVFGLISITKATRTNVTLVGVIHRTPHMAEVLGICDSRTQDEADKICALGVEGEELNDLCKLRLDVDMSKFTNKCLRYYKHVDRMRASQNKLTEFLQHEKHQLLIHESKAPANIPGLSGILSQCKTPESRPDCLLSINAFFLDKWHEKSHVDYLFEEQELAEFIKKHPDFEEEMRVCKDYQIEEKCRVMNEFMKLHADVTEKYLKKSHVKDVIVIMGQEHLNYVSCKNFDQARYNCRDVSLL